MIFRFVSGFHFGQLVSFSYMYFKEFNDVIMQKHFEYFTIDRYAFLLQGLEILKTLIFNLLTAAPPTRVECSFAGPNTHPGLPFVIPHPSLLRPPTKCAVGLGSRLHADRARLAPDGQTSWRW